MVVIHFGIFGGIAAQFGKALAFNGCTDYHEFPHDDRINFTDGVTLEAWIRPNCADEAEIIVSKQWCLDQYAYALSIKDGRLAYTFSRDGTCNSTDLFISRDIWLPAGEWHHIAAVHTTSEVKLFVDGVQRPGTYERGGFGIPARSTEPLRLGAYKNLGSSITNFYSGLLDEVRVWNIALTNQDILSQYRTSLSGSEPNLLIYFTMEENDISNDLRLSNMATRGLSESTTAFGAGPLHPYTTFPEPYDDQFVDIATSPINCEVDEVTLMIVDTTWKSVSWSTGASNNQIVVPNVVSTITVAAETDRCYFLRDTVVLENLVRIEVDTTLCEGETLVLPSGEYDVAGVYQDTTTGISSCDTVTFYELTFVSQASVLIEPTVCKGEKFEFQGTQLSIGADTIFAINNSTGCDSFVQVKVSLEYVVQDSLLILCPGESATISGRTYDSEGIYRDTSTISTVCDTIHVYTLLYRDPQVQQINLEACSGEMVSYEGSLLSAGTDSLFQLTSINGCDSLVQVTVRTIYEVADSLILLCPGEGVVIAGTTQSEAGLYRDTTNNSMGCDTAYTFNVAFREVENTLVEIQTCASGVVAYNNSSLLPGTDTTFILQSYYGCDSLVRVKVVTREIANEILEILFCPGDSVAYEGIVIPLGDTTAFQYTTDEGCDSILLVVPGLYDSIPDFLGPDTTVCRLPMIMTFQDTTLSWDHGDFSREVLMNRDGVYRASRMDSSGCVYFDEINIDKVSGNYYIPTAFSPNFDGVNDCFQLFMDDINRLSSFEFIVFDRWGDQVFYTNSPLDCWNGQFRERPLNSGLFVYHITFFDDVCGDFLEYSGEISLVR